MTPDRAAVAFPGVRIPASVNVDGERLVYDWKQPTSEFRQITDRALLEFSKLGNATPEVIAEFARRHGVLEASRVKTEHQDRSDLVLTDGTIWRFAVLPGLAKEEQLDLWRALAEEIRCLLKINAALKGRRSKYRLPALSPHEWKILSPQSDAPIDDVRDEQFLFQFHINDWLLMGGVRLELSSAGYSRKETDWSLEVTYNGLVGALAYRLLLMVVGEDRLYVCSGCGTPYVRSVRAPQPGQENFCPDCSEIARQRAVDRYREKLRKENLRKRKR